MTVKLTPEMYEGLPARRLSHGDGKDVEDVSYVKVGGLLIAVVLVVIGAFVSARELGEWIGLWQGGGCG